MGRDVIVEIWQEFLKIVREEAGSRVVETWLKAVRLYQWDAIEKTLFIEAPNAFVKDWIQSNYTHLFQLHLGRLLHVENPRVIFTTSLEQDETGVGKNMIVAPASQVFVAHKSNMLPAQNFTKQYGKLNPNYQFETFVVGPNNSLAYAAACAIAQDPGNQYNPFLIYGGSGLGKTHLLHAIGNAIQRKNQSAVVFYQTTDRFVNEFISAIRFNKVHLFQQKYRSIDVLLIDDIQFISHKEQTQEAFFHIFNALYDGKKQIIFSSDMFPRQIQGLEERLRSRLEWGLVADIHKPQLETKIAIVKKKAAVYHEAISDEIAHIIAQQPVSNIRELEGTLVRILAFASLTKQSITLELVRKVLSQEPVHRIEELVDFNKIVSCVCKHYAYKLSDLRSENRSKDLSFARQVTMYLMKKMTGKSLKEIGSFLGRKNHSTVLHAFDRVLEAVEKDASIKTTVHNLEAEILR